MEQPHHAGDIGTSGVVSVQQAQVNPVQTDRYSEIPIWRKVRQFMKLPHF
jgi:hypothetical protein